MKRVGISEFDLKLLREERLAELTENFPKADAFQQLCYDLLVQDFKDRNNSIRFSRYETEGADGGVDISGEDSSNHNLIIVECKKNDSSSAAEQALEKLSRKLQENLSKPNAVKIRYGPWFDTRFKRYIYCVSYFFKDLNKKEVFKEQICKMLHDLSEIAGLQHLAQVAENVELYSWNDLGPILDNSPFIYHRWIKYELPLGVESLTSPLDVRQTLKYKNYLSDNRLKYFSRDEYLKHNPQVKGLVSETHILDKLLMEDGEPNCILFGEGGIGKTRLMLELGHLAEKQEWTAYNIITKSPQLEKLRGLFQPHSKYVLLFDYIEESDVFRDPEFFEQLARICPGAEIRVICNCRKSHFDISMLAGQDDFNRVNISIKDQVSEQAFKKGMVSHILGDLKEIFQYDKDFAELRPAFAVFLRYLHEKYNVKDQFRLSEKGSFKQWLKKQLCRTYKVTNYHQLAEKGERFYLFSVLTSGSSIPAQGLRIDHEDDVIGLLKDGWIDKNDEDGREVLSVIHDTISEEILLIRLLERQELLRSEIEKIFLFSIKYGHEALKNCFIHFERIFDVLQEQTYGSSSSSNKLHIIMYRVFDRLIDSHPKECAILSHLLPRTILMSDEDILSLLLEKESFFQQEIKEANLGLVLAFKMKSFYKQRKNINPDTLVQLRLKIQKLTQKWVLQNPNYMSSSYISSRLLAYGILFCGLNDDSFSIKQGETLRIQSIEWMKKYSLSKEFSLVLPAWLDAGGEIGVVQDYIENWFKAFPLVKEADYILKSWLNAGGDKGFVFEYVKAWIGAYYLDYEACYLFCSWLKNGGEKKFVQEYVEKWLMEYPLEKETDFVLKSWLDANGEKSVVQKYLKNWLKKFPLEKETDFVMKSWLKAKGDVRVVHEYIEKWFEKFPIKKETCYLLKSWLNAKGDVGVVQEYVEKWLKEFPLEKETDFVLKSWLSAGGEIGIVQEYVVKWLKKFPLEWGTSRLLQSWLKANGEKKVVREYLENWIKEFPLEKETPFILKSWLDAKGEIGAVQEYVKNWLKEFPLEKETSFLLKSWLDAKGEIGVVQEYVEKWLERFSLERKADFILKSWLDAGGEKGVVQEYVKNWLKEFPLEKGTSRLLNCWLKANGEKEVVQEYVENWLKEYSLEKESYPILQSLLKAKGEKEVVREYLEKWLKMYPLEKETCFILQSWLRANGEKEVVWEYVEIWLKKFPLEWETSYLLQSWLKANGEKEVVWEYLENWIKEFPLEKGTSRLLNSWLKANGEKELVRDYIEKWLKMYPLEKETHFILKSWLNAGGERGVLG